MANFGVNIDEVWQQASLVQPPSGPAKRSPYTVPVNSQAQPGTREGFDAPQKNSGGDKGGGDRGDRGDRGGGQDYHRPNYNTMEIPISGPEQTRVTAPPHPSSHSSPPPSDIPRLKEQLMQQIDAVTGCQKEVLYLKSLVQTLKRELQEADQKRQHQQRADKKQKLMGLIWMMFVGLFLIAIVVMLVQVSQKMSQLLSQPLLMG